MARTLLIIQNQTNLAQLQQAVDTALVAAIFGTSPCILSFIDETLFAHTSAKPELQDKVSQLLELNTKVFFAANMASEEIRALVDQADTLFSY